MVTLRLTYAPVAQTLLWYFFVDIDLLLNIKYFYIFKYIFVFLKIYIFKYIFKYKVFLYLTTRDQCQ